MRNIIVGLSTLVSTSVPLASAARTASSISRCDVTPTTLRYLRISMLSRSSFMASSVNLPANDNARASCGLNMGRDRSTIRSISSCSAANRVRARIASPGIFPKAEPLPHLICSRPMFIGEVEDEADQHDGTGRVSGSDNGAVFASGQDGAGPYPRRVHGDYRLSPQACDAAASIGSTGSAFWPTAWAPDLRRRYPRSTDRDLGGVGPDLR